MIINVRKLNHKSLNEMLQQYKGEITLDDCVGHASLPLACRTVTLP